MSAVCLVTCHFALSILLLANDSFSPKKFFAKVGLSKKSPPEIEKIFCDPGPEGRLNNFFNFSKGACPLTAAETRAFLLAGDSDRGGKIGWDEFSNLVMSS
uniref:Parvalbumin n=1 Tax=Oncorhynchus tshawytscha TaxID=74940 RepID=A0A8C8HBV8_ONCTS